MRILLLALVLFSASCMSPKRIAKKQAKACAICPTRSQVKDSTVTIIKDTTIYITEKGETIILDSPCSDLCDELGNIKVFAQTKRKNGIVSTIKTVKGKLSFDCEADSLKAVIKGLKETKSFRMETITVEKIVIEKTKWNGFTHWWFWISIGLLLTYIGLKKFTSWLPF